MGKDNKSIEWRTINSLNGQIKKKEGGYR